MQQGPLDDLQVKVAQREECLKPLVACIAPIDPDQSQLANNTRSAVHIGVRCEWYWIKQL